MIYSNQLMGYIIFPRNYFFPTFLAIKITITITSATRKNAQTIPALKIVCIASQLLRQKATQANKNKFNFCINEYLMNK